MPSGEICWPHAPLHQLTERGAYFVTAGTYLKAHHFRGRQRLDVLHRGLLKVAHAFQWQLEAWAVFSNHYHFIALSPPEAEDAASLAGMISTLHALHQNPVKHGLVPVANQYPWCSAAWFERVSSAAMVKAIYRFKVDQVRVWDDFEPLGPK